MPCCAAGTHGYLQGQTQPIQKAPTPPYALFCCPTPTKGQHPVDRRIRIPFPDRSSYPCFHVGPGPGRDPTRLGNSCFDAYLPCAPRQFHPCLAKSFSVPFLTCIGQNGRTLSITALHYFSTLFLFNTLFFDCAFYRTCGHLLSILADVLFRSFHYCFFL